MKSLTNSNVNLKEEIFALAYIKDLDATKAWIAANPDKGKKYASGQGYKWLNRPFVKKRLQQLAKQKLEEANAGTERILADLERIAFFDPACIMQVDQNGEPHIDLTKLTPEIRRCLKFKFGSSVTKDGDRVPIYQAEPYDKMDAIEKLLKIHQLYRGEDLTNKQPTGITVNVNFPLPGGGWRDNQAHIPDVIDAEEV
jgi:hypothetical protein